MVSSVAQYLVDGCMRCKLGATPACKVHRWIAEIETLRHIVLECGLNEEVKWGVPCYTLSGKNVVMVSAFKEYACLSFFKGSLLKDPAKILVKQGEYGQEGRILKFTEQAQILDQADTIKAYILEAIALEKAGKKVEKKAVAMAMPEELLGVFEQDHELRDAFNRLTPGRQRGYLIYFSQPKQSASKLNRIEKCRAMILEGVGLHDKYSGGS
jgi:uncharacterized protein YdeI (YjbR/CyaY-like superfamily)